jgi:hypothetical protein
MARRSVRLEERYGRNRCKVDDDSIRLQGMPSRTLVTHRITRAIQPRTRARSSAEADAASIALIFLAELVIAAAYLAWPCGRAVMRPATLISPGPS